MKTIENVVDFDELCLHAVSSGIVGDWNTAIDILQENCLPWPEETFLWVGMKYLEDVKSEQAREIVKTYMEENQVQFLNITN